MTHQRLLMTCFYFPPCGGVAVQRSLKFAKYLEQFGWSPLVLTEDERAFRHLPQDSELLKELCPDAEIIRTPGSRREMIFRWIHRLRLNRIVDFFTPIDMHFWWAAAAYRLARRLVRDKRVSALYTTSGPPSAHLVGLWLARREAIPWVADFRDPWTQWHAYRPRTSLHARLDAHVERRVLEKADLVIANTEGSRGLLLVKHGERFAGKVVVIPNGYDGADFDGIPRSTHRPGKLSLVYTGTVYGNYGDPCDREFPRGFFLALSCLKEERSDSAQIMDVVFVGKFSESNQRVLDDLGLRDVVRVVGHVSHTRAIQYAVDADANLLLMAGWPGNMVQAKLYELIRAGRPIMALTPEGDAHVLLAKLGNPYWAEPDDVEAVFAQLRRLVADCGPNRSRDFAFDPGLVCGFDRRFLTQQLAAHLDRLLGVRVGGQAESGGHIVT